MSETAHDRTTDRLEPRRGCRPGRRTRTADLRWGHAFDADEPRSVLVDDDGMPVPTLRPERADGTALTPANTHVETV